MRLRSWPPLPRVARYIVARPACSKRNGSVRPTAAAGQMAATKHNANVAAKPTASFAQGMIKRRDHAAANVDVAGHAGAAVAGHDAEAQAKDAGHDADQQRLGHDQAETARIASRPRPAARPNPTAGHESRPAPC